MDLIYLALNISSNNGRVVSSPQAWIYCARKLNVKDTKKEGKHLKGMNIVGRSKDNIFFFSKGTGKYSTWLRIMALFEEK